MEINKLFNMEINLEILEILQNVENIVERRKRIRLDPFELSDREFI